MEKGIKMRELKVTINKKVNIRELITNTFKEMNLKEYYMKEFKNEESTVYFFVYELSFPSYKQVKFFSRAPGEIIVTTSVVAEVNQTSTNVSFILSTDDEAKIPNHLCIVLLEHGFKIVK
jgi:hypothetical protein